MKKLQNEALQNEEYIKIVDEILNNEEFLKRKKYKHHGEKSVYKHSLEVSYLSYIISKKLKLNYTDAAIGGLLHDFYYEDWHLVPKEKNILKKHGFTHARQALENTKNIFPQYINEKTQNIILRHMFPLNIIPPKYIESWIVSMELLNKKDFLICMGLKKRSGNNE